MGNGVPRGNFSAGLLQPVERIDFCRKFKTNKRIPAGAFPENIFFPPFPHSASLWEQEFYGGLLITRFPRVTFTPVFSSSSLIFPDFVPPGHPCNSSRRGEASDSARPLRLQCSWQGAAACQCWVSFAPLPSPLLPPLPFPPISGSVPSENKTADFSNGFQTLHWESGAVSLGKCVL